MSESHDNTPKVSEDFKKKIVQWVKLDDDLRKIRVTTKEINEDKKQAEEFILTYLNNIGEKEIAISDGKLSKQVTKTQGPLKKEHILKAINEIIKDDNKSLQMTEHIFKSRQGKEKIALKRIKIKKN